MADAKVIRTLMSGLIRPHFGCLDAAAETINDTHGGDLSKGTLSKWGASGHWPTYAVATLEDAAGRYPITRMLARRLEVSQPTIADSMTLAASTAKECGEAVFAIINAVHSELDGDKAKAIAEIDGAIDALRENRARLEAK